MASHTVTIYGSNEDITATEYPDTTTVEALSDMVSYEFQAPWTRGYLEFIDDVEDYLNGNIQGMSHIRLTWKIETEHQDYPASPVTFEEYYLTELLQKKYKWLHIPDYNLRPASLTTSKCVAVQFYGNIEIDENPGQKKLIFNIKKRSIGI